MLQSPKTLQTNKVSASNSTMFLCGADLEPAYALPIYANSMACAKQVFRPPILVTIALINDKLSLAPSNTCPFLTGLRHSIVMLIVARMTSIILNMLIFSVRMELFGLMTFLLLRPPKNCRRLVEWYCESVAKVVVFVAFCFALL
jgi:hypothetical protein